MAKVGYVRVSSVGQSLDVQREKLFEEKRNGTIDARPMLKQCLNYVREGDVLIVSRIDRLARSTLHLCQIAETLREKGVDLVVLDQNIDTSDATGRLLFNMLGAIGQFETEIRAGSQMDGIKKQRIAAYISESGLSSQSAKSQNCVTNANNAHLSKI